MQANQYLSILPWYSSEGSSTNIGDLVIGEVESSHETHTSEAVCIKPEIFFYKYFFIENLYENYYKKIPGEFVVVHVQNSQEAVSGKNSTMNFTHIVVGDI